MISMRPRVGDVLQVTDGRGVLADCVVVQLQKSLVSLEVTNKVVLQPELLNFGLAVAPTKNADRMEWLLEKCVEIGIKHFWMVITENTERTHIKTERFQRLAISAMKQSGGTFLPDIRLYGSSREFVLACSEANVHHKLIAHLVPGISSVPYAKLVQQAVSGLYMIAVGPEGDFTPEEVELALDNGFQPVSLGSKRLRTETAGMVACSVFNLCHNHG